MAIVCSLLVLNNLSSWQQRLHSADFVQPPWHDQHPARLAIEADLPSDLLRLARTIDAMVDRLSMSHLVASYRGRGSSPHRPDLMLKAILFLVQRGKHSPADWYFQAYENRLVQWLLRGSRPSRARWYDFRRRLVPLIDDLNKQLLGLALQQGLLDVQLPILDGSLLAANSTRHKLLNLTSLLRRLGQLDEAIAADEAPTKAAELAAAPPQDSAAEPVAAANSPAPLQQPVLEPTPAAAGTAAATGDPALPLPKPVKPAGATGGCGDRPAWMAQTSSGRQEQRRHYHKVQQELDKRLRHNAKRRKADRKAVEQVRISPGDPEASLGLDKERVYRPLYNSQVMCDLDTDFYLAYGIFSGVQDGATLLPMLGRLHYFVPGVDIDWLMTDAGYANGSNLRELEEEEIALLAPWQENDWSKGKKAKKQIPKSEFVWDEQSQTYRCPEGHTLKYQRTQTIQRGDHQEKHRQYRCPAEHCLNCPRQGECTSKPASGRMVVRNEYEEEVLRHKKRMEAQEAKELYRKRKEQVERRYADSKQHRGLRRLSMRGKDGAHLQLGLTVLAGNLVTFDKLASALQDASPSPSSL